MIPAMLGLMAGGLLARLVLWPLELHLEHERLLHHQVLLEDLERRMKEET